jgi:hypothetical protein
MRSCAHSAISVRGDADARQHIRFDPSAPAPQNWCLNGHPGVWTHDPATVQCDGRGPWGTTLWACRTAARCASAAATEPDAPADEDLDDL